ncbi:hypothetical protein F5146DRAFT_1003907 [Armillaria mellea]|nr:hypothetical protein F5146DRAFT_1003907 [Armillaria mellea]
MHIEERKQAEVIVHLAYEMDSRVVNRNRGGKRGRKIRGRARRNGTECFDDIANEQAPLGVIHRGRIALLLTNKLRMRVASIRVQTFSVRDDDEKHTLEPSVTHWMQATQPWHSPSLTRFPSLTSDDCPVGHVDLGVKGGYLKRGWRTLVKDNHGQSYASLPPIASMTIRSHSGRGPVRGAVGEVLHDGSIYLLIFQLVEERVTLPKLFLPTWIVDRYSNSAKEEKRQTAEKRAGLGIPNSPSQLRIFLVGLFRMLPSSDALPTVDGDSDMQR